MTGQRHLLRALTVALFWLGPRWAFASATFPDVVKDEWQLPTVPECTLCHQDLVGGFGTATKPFGRAVLMNGGTAVDTAALRRALRAMAAADSDVDHDGVSDITELQMGADPDVFNDYGVDAGPVSETFDDTPLPQTGCSIVAVGRREPSLAPSARLTGPRPSPTVGPTSGAGSPARRISDDAILVCGLCLGVVLVRVRGLRLQRKRVASSTR